MNKDDGDIQDEMQAETVRDGIMSELHREDEFAAERLASAIESAERGHPLDRRDREDAELAPLVAAAALLRRTWDAITPDPDYFARSRGVLLDSMKRPQPEAVPLSFLDRLRQSRIFMPVASAAAAAAITLAVVLPSLGGDATTTIVSPPLAVALPQPTAGTFEAPPALLSGLDLIGFEDQLSLLGELREIASTLATIQERTARDLSVDAVLLRTLTAAHTRATIRIIADAGDFTRNEVVTYTVAGLTARQVLENVTVTSIERAALDAARAAVQDGVLSAAIYLERTLDR